VSQSNVQPGESDPKDAQKIRAVTEALAEVGEEAEPKEVAEYIREHTGMSLVAGEVGAIEAESLPPEATPPGPSERGLGPVHRDERHSSTRRRAMQVKDVMTRGAQCIGPDATLQEAARKMKDLDVGPLPICDNDHLVGMLTDRDITVRAVAEGRDPRTAKVRDAMSEGVCYCFEDDDVSAAAQVVREKQVRRLVVLTSDKRLAGIVSLGDLAVETGDEHLAGKTLEHVSQPTG